MSEDIRFARDNYGFFYWQEPLVTTAYVFDEKHVIDPMMNGYALFGQGKRGLAKLAALEL